jgi:hypothetical protein
MKAERRHELKTNALARGLDHLPEFGRKYGNKLLLGFIFVLLAIILIQMRNRSAKAAEQEAVTNLSNARMALLQMTALDGQNVLPDKIAEARNESIGQIEAGIEQALKATDDPAVQADALALRGDLNWTLAMLAPLPGATTRPALNLKNSQSEYLSAAEKAYTQVANNYSNQAIPAMTAKFGLAAIAENRGAWDEAEKQYDAIIKDPNAMPAHKSLALARQYQLPELKVKIAIGTPSTMPIEPPTPARQIIDSAWQPTTARVPDLTPPPTTSPATLPSR